ncbi:MAG: hypothetical protein JNL12_19365 [Planctomycetes bacterium]|nr:hypothetical protein [Planctomycetota bacterium]
MNPFARFLVAATLLVAIPSGCARSSGRSETEPVLAAASIGPAGGALVVDAGDYAGLELLVPPGALAGDTEVRLVAVFEPQPMLVTLPAASQVFRIEPESLVLLAPATLRVPYFPERVYETAPGNVVVRTSVGGLTVDRPPVLVDLAARRMVTTIDRFGACRVVPGPVAALDDYRPTLGDVVDLGSGIVFVAEAVPADSPFHASADERWRVSGPAGDLMLYFADELLVGRESTIEDRREQLASGVEVWRQGDRTLPPPPAARPFLLEQPIGTAPVLGAMVVFGAWYWDRPQFVVDQLVADTIRLRVSLGWSGNDQPSGSTDLEFVFGAGLGLLAFVEDGVERTRQTP